MQNGIENGWLKDFKSFREYFDFKVKTKNTPSSLVNPFHNMTKDQISPNEISFDMKHPNVSMNDGKLREQKIQNDLKQFKDDDFSKEDQITDFGRLLRAHTNYCLIKFFLAYKKTNVAMISKTASLVNNLFSFSRDTLKQNKGLEMLPFEKNELRDQFNDNKHHAVTAINILMFLQRKKILVIDVNKSGGKKLEWIESRVQKFIDEVIPNFYEKLSKDQATAAALIKQYGVSAYQDPNNSNFKIGKISKNEKETYHLKHFAERYSAILHLIQHPKDINKYAEKVHNLVKTKAPNPETAVDDGKSCITGITKSTASTDD